MSKFKIGDTVQLTTANPIRSAGSLSRTALKAGEFPVGTVTGFDSSDGDVIVNFPDHSGFYATESELKLVEATVAIAPVVEDKLVLGDRVVVVTGNWAPEATNDEVLTVVEDDANKDYFALNGTVEITFANFHLKRGDLQRAAELTKATKEALEVGGEYIITDRKEPSIHAFTNGTKVKIKELPYRDSANADTVALDGKHKGTGQYVPVTDLARVEVVKATPVVEAPKEAAFKVGDKVRLIVKSNPRYGWGDVKTGAEGTITSITTAGKLYINFPAQSHWAADPKEVVLIDAVKAPKVKAPKVKPSKEVAFKVGDKVRLIVDADQEPRFGWGEVETGAEGVIVRIDAQGDLRINFPAQSNWIAPPKGEVVLVEATAPTKAPADRAERVEDPLYAVVHESRQGDFLFLTGDREDARIFKARKGGKRAGYIINLYTKAKEIR